MTVEITVYSLKNSANAVACVKRSEMLSMGFQVKMGYGYGGGNKTLSTGASASSMGVSGKKLRQLV